MLLASLFSYVDSWKFWKSQKNIECSHPSCTRCIWAKQRTLKNGRNCFTLVRFSMQMQGLKPHNKPRNTYLQIRQEIPLACRGGQHRQWSCETTQAYHSCPVLIHWCFLQLECLPVEKNPNQEMLILLCKSPSTNSMANLRPKSKTIVYQSSGVRCSLSCCNTNPNLSHIKLNRLPQLIH